MAFKTVAASSAATLTTLYTVPASKEAVVHAIFITPKVAETKVDIKANGFYIGYRIPLVLGGSLFYPKPANLETGDTIQALTDVAADCDIFLSILEKDV